MFIRIAEGGSLLFILFLGACHQNETQESDNMGYMKMNIHRYPLPLKKESEAKHNFITPLEYVDEKKSLDSLVKTVEQDTALSAGTKREKIFNFQKAMGELNKDAFITIQKTVCGDFDHAEEIEKYVPRMGIPKDFIQKVGRSVGMLRWNNDFGTMFHGEGDNEGDVKGRNWGSGCLIGDDYFLTAGHVFEPMVNEFTTPIKAGLAVESADLAKLMNVVFNYEVDSISGQVRKDTMSFPVLQLIEYRHGGRDYAIVRLGKNGDVLPGRKFGHLVPDPQDDPTNGEALCIIQHPMGMPKRVDIGPLKYFDQFSLFYDHIDTEGGASGSPVVGYPSAHLKGVHILGGCTKVNGSNEAVKIQSIKLYSQVLQQ